MASYTTEMSLPKYLWVRGEHNEYYQVFLVEPQKYIDHIDNHSILVEYKNGKQDTYTRSELYTDVNTLKLIHFWNQYLENNIPAQDKSEGMLGIYCEIMNQYNNTLGAL